MNHDYTLEQCISDYQLRRISGEVNAHTPLLGISSIQNPKPDHLCYALSDQHLHEGLKQCGALLVPPKLSDQYLPAPIVLEHPQPQYVVADLAAHFMPERPWQAPAGIASSASIATSATIAQSASIATGVVIGEGVIIGEGCYIGPNTTIDAQVTIGNNTIIHSRCSIGDRVEIGTNCRIQSGAVIGSEGFGFNPTKEHWQAIPHLGTVIIGDRVHIGANTTIDRGAIDNTIIENDVILDNQIQIAHNVFIGHHTAIAGCVGIAGSATIGAHCLIGGGVGIAGHLSIADGTQINGMSFVSKSIKKSGQYASGMPIMERGRWNKTVATLRRLVQQKDTT